MTVSIEASHESETAKATFRLVDLDRLANAGDVDR